MDLLDMVVKIVFDSSQYEKGLDKTEEKAVESQNKLSGIFGKIATATAAAFAAAASAAATGIAALTKSAVSAYGEYEQLKGGIETLFTGEAAQTVIKNADKAFSTAGISANEYMNTAIGFSGALLRSLGNDTKKTAKLTHTAITDMADQANKYGKTVQEVSQTYTSLARGNYQTLDNLFGGMFAGTKKGLRDMLDYAQQYRASMGQVVEYSGESYADIVSAIHDISEAMGITGTTAAEAAGTIQGSTGSMKAAWENFVTALADPSMDAGKKFDEFAATAKTAFNNLAPKIKEAIKGIGKVIKKEIPALKKELPELIKTFLPSIIDGASELAIAFFEVLPDIIDTAFTSAGLILQKIRAKLEEQFPELAPLFESFSELVKSVLNAFQSLFEYIESKKELKEALTTAINAVITVLSAVMNVAKGLLDYIAAHGEVVEGLATSFLILESAIFAYKTGTIVAQGVATAFGIIMDVLTGKINLVAIAQGALNVVMSLNPIGLVIAAITALVAALIYLWNNCEGFRNFILGVLDTITWAYEAAIQGCIDSWTWLIDKWQNGIDTIGKWVAAIKKFFEDLPETLYNIGVDMINGLMNGVNSVWDKFKNNWESGFNSIIDGAKSILQINSPSKVMARIGGYMGEGLQEGWNNAFDDFENDIDKNLDFNSRYNFNTNMSQPQTTNANPTPNYPISITIENFINNRDEDIDELTERIMDNMELKMSRRRTVYA